VDVVEILKIREIRTEDEFQALHKIWNSLLSKSNDDDIFLTWEWISTWWKYYGNEHQLLVMVAEKEEEIISIAPLMCSEYSILGVNLKEIGFIGTPDSDYNGFILTNQKRESLRLFLNRLMKYAIC